jgi:hypothetical protein
MMINYVGHSTLHTPTHNIHLNNILHVPSTHKNLLSVHKLTTDNPIFIEYHSHYFLVKDRATRNVILHALFIRIKFCQHRSAYSFHIELILHIKKSFLKIILPRMHYMAWHIVFF